MGSKNRRRGRTALLIGTAAVLGLVAGTATGYAIQADRAPAPLPVLGQPGLAYPAKPLPAGRAAKPLSAAEDSRVRTDGDLRKLLLGKPAGAKLIFPDWIQQGWTTIDRRALDFDDEKAAFEDLVGEDFRRAAAISWAEGKAGETHVSLVQYRDQADLRAAEQAETQRYWAVQGENGPDDEGVAIKGSGNGRYYLYDVAQDPGQPPLYGARAIAHRGDILMDIFIYDSEPISEKRVRTLAERQLERL
ncbi:hypothetical protein [Streptomyces corynorhini]|uniref:hypothetical protein n=1 Tax=Streptomyces corynorhini TaxID=2282652 RepID=UPI001F1FB02A|nr:hypothetical protein [Streptomyces corynorhini]